MRNPPMNTRINPAATALIAASAIAAVAASPILAQQQPQRGGERLPQECRAEIVQLCGKPQQGARDQMRICLAEKASQLSETCRTAIRARMEARCGLRGGEQAPPPQTLYFGNDSLQGIDLWVPQGANKAPLVLFVHGGGWRAGSKNASRRQAMPVHMLQQGYAFASIDYRLVPRNTVEEQAGDVAAALAHILKRADALGIDRSRVVLTGHSAGAHLVALVGTDERHLKAVGLSFADIDGVMPNDGAAYDVATQLTVAGPRMKEAYEKAFGTDPARRAALSPMRHAARPNAPAFLLLHAQHPDAVAQTKALAEALRQGGSQAEVAGFPGQGLRGHMEINRKLGQPDFAATAVMDTWLKKVLG
jgi:acetyl esterase/lipase